MTLALATRRSRRPSLRRDAKSQLALWLRGSGWGWREEYAFCPGRRFRFDWANERLLIAVEFEGGVYVGGRHTRPAGYTRDCEKYSLAAVLGWCVIRCTADMVLSGLAYDLIGKAVASRTTITDEVGV